MEYRSRLSLLGVPLVHIHVAGMDPSQPRGLATGWFALGDVALGILFSCGGLALGGVSVGGIALGVIPVGGLALGLLAFGGLAGGFVAAGGVAIAWRLALGGLAIARHQAFGGLALGENPSHGTPPPKLWPGAPEAPFRLEDAAWLAVFVAGIWLVIHLIQERRREKI
jgi:hypothetical protein